MIEANIMDTQDIDCYQVSAPGSSLTISMSASEGLKPDVVVFDAERNQLFEEYRQTPGAIMEKKFDTQAGRLYYFKVKPFDTAGSYTLTVK